MTYSNDQTALLMLDLQNEMTSSEGKIGGGGLAAVVEEREVLEHAASLLGAARENGVLPVHVRLGFRPDYEDVLSRAPRIENLKENGACQVDSWGCEFPEVVAPANGELVVTKKCVNPFFNTGLATYLLQRGRIHVVLCGVVTNLVVEAAARAADDAGFAVTVAEDTCAAPNPDWHAFSVENILPMFGTVTSSNEIASSFNA